MIAFFKNLLRWEPIYHARWELVIMRMLFAMLIWDTQSAWAADLWNPADIVKAMLTRPFDWDIPFTAQPHPNGIAMFMDITWISIDWVEKSLRLLTFLSLIAFVGGVSAAYALAIPTAFGILAATLGNSQGSIGHTAQLLHQAMLGIWLASVWALVWRLKGRPLWRGFTLSQLEMEVGRQVVIAGYVASAVSKLIESKAQWFINAKYLPIHVVKNNDMKFYQLLDPVYQTYEGVAKVMLEHPLICQLVFGLGLPLELFAFFALRNRRMALFFGASLWFFHYTVMRLMNLFFFFNMGLLITFLICPWWWLAEGWRKLRLRDALPGA
jgi:hypothetical protein